MIEFWRFVRGRDRTTQTRRLWHKRGECCAIRMPCHFYCRPSGGDDALKNLGRAQQTRLGAHTPCGQGSNAITVRPLPRPIVDRCRHTRLGLKLMEEAAGHDGGEPVQAGGTQARRHTRSRNPGPLGNEASSGLYHASTLGRLRPPDGAQLRRGCACVPASPTLQCDGADPAA